MKNMNHFAGKMLAGAVAVAMITLASQAIADNVPQLITVIKVDGNARYSVDNGKSWQKLKRGDELQAGTVIETAEKSIVDILMGEHQGPILASPAGAPSPVHSAGDDSGPKSNVVRVEPSSVLAIDKLTLEKTGTDEVSETQLDLRAGQIMGNVKKLSAASRYEVKIPNGVAGIRGTTYLVSATGVVYVLTGQVIISYVGPGGTVVTQTVGAGESFNPFNGPGGSAGSGAVAPIPPTVLVALQASANQLNAPITTYSKGPTSNPTLVHISTD
jgi:FecR protein